MICLQSQPLRQFFSFTVVDIKRDTCYAYSEIHSAYPKNTGNSYLGCHFLRDQLRQNTNNRWEDPGNMNIEMCADHCSANEQTLANLYVSKAITIVDNNYMPTSNYVLQVEATRLSDTGDRSTHPPTSQIIMTYDRTICFCVSATEWQRLPMFRRHGIRC